MSCRTTSAPPHIRSPIPFAYSSPYAPRLIPSAEIFLPYPPPEPYGLPLSRQHHPDLAADLAHSLFKSGLGPADQQILKRNIVHKFIGCILFIQGLFKPFLHSSFMGKAPGKYPLIKIPVIPLPLGSAPLLKSNHPLPISDAPSLIRASRPLPRGNTSPYPFYGTGLPAEYSIPVFSFLFHRNRPDGMRGIGTA